MSKRDEAADAFTHRLAQCDLTLTTKTDLLKLASDWAYAATQDAIDASFAAANNAINSIGKVPS